MLVDMNFLRIYVYLVSCDNHYDYECLCDVMKRDVDSPDGANVLRTAEDGLPFDVR